MTVKFTTSIRNLTIGRGILSGIAASVAVSIYSGAQPTAANIITNWTSYNSTNSIFLLHYSSVGFTQPASGILMTVTTFPAATLPTNTGTGAWAIIWATNPLIAAMSGAIPTTSFIVGPVSDSVGNGIIRFSNTTITTGVSKSLLDGSIGALST
jgi:hypothetical protein